MEYDISAAHRLVRQQRAMGNDCEWQGWDIVFYRPSDMARTSKDGVWRDGQWQFANRSVVNSRGIWTVDPRNIKRSRRARS